MAIALLLLPADGGDVALGPEALSRLRGLGVTRVSVLRDEREVAVVLEGWAFEPAASAGAALTALAPDGGRTLHPIVHMAVSPAREQGGLE